MFANIFKPKVLILVGVILVGVLVLVLTVPAVMVSAAAPTPTAMPPQNQPAGKVKVTSASLEKDYKEELEALKAQDNNLTRVANLESKANVSLTNLKNKGRDVDILQTILNLFKQDLANATSFHDQAKQILDTHAGFDNNGKVVDQAQALDTVLSARDKLMEARITLRGGLGDVRQAIQFFHKRNPSNLLSNPAITPTPTSMPAQFQ